MKDEDDFIRESKETDKAFREVEKIVNRTLIPFVIAGLLLLAGCFWKLFKYHFLN